MCVVISEWVELGNKCLWPQLRWGGSQPIITAAHYECHGQLRRCKIGLQLSRRQGHLMMAHTRPQTAVARPSQILPFFFSWNIWCTTLCSLKHVRCNVSYLFQFLSWRKNILPSIWMKCCCFFLWFVWSFSFSPRWPWVHMWRVGS